MGKISNFLVLVLLIPISSSYPQERTAEVNERETRFFDTYVSNHRNPILPDEGIVDVPLPYDRPPPPLDYYPNRGFVPYHPAYFGFPVGYVPPGNAIFCPMDYAYDGFSNPLEAGICHVDYYDFYY